MPRTLSRFVGPTVLALTCSVLVGNPSALAEQPDLPDQDAELLTQAVNKGLTYLTTTGQSPDGTFSPKAGSGLTSLALTAMLRNGRAVDDPAVAKGLTALQGFIKPDGGIYAGGRFQNYETCVAILCFGEANKDGRYNEILKRAKDFLIARQVGVDGSRETSDPWYGGLGYGESGRPDLSNTTYMIEALRAADADANDVAIQRAILFISRCQNLDSKHNDTRFGKLVNDGGFYYEIPLESVDPAKSPDRFTENGGLRSYGSMTYSGLKSMIYAGLKKEDPRVKAAVDWISKHYSTDKNPGMGTAGLYYYYHTFGAALIAAGLDEVTDSAGKKHNWRSDLIKELADRQQPDGSWLNENSRWLENEKNLSTSFALMALAYCQPPAIQAK